MIQAVRTLKLLSLLVFFFIGLGTISTPPLLAQERKAPLVVCYSALVASQSIPWIAKEAGFFDRQGLAVRLVYIASSSKSTAALLSGDVDACITGGIGIMRAKLAGAEVYQVPAHPARRPGQGRRGSPVPDR
ncbi:MAG: ABC transporter substrate-binding protein [Candidatus Tectomicrobia bacterium]|uniref:ABC transporter substrate-binding protein n=1 Tax=Tectimicrobiota bacterium TaxID=2528274 RepID=A0A932GPX7_UNCTE|nr:ABC transporter substrate-binding protein [Candidatus Tectomicrobia bacterium]